VVKAAKGRFSKGIQGPEASNHVGRIPGAGQIELYTHLPLMRQLIQHIQSLDYRVVGLYLLDSQFMG
jgi:hypothetical protein